MIFICGACGVQIVEADGVICDECAIEKAEIIEKYKKGDFCADVRCENRRFLMSGRKYPCRKCDAYLFHEWLEENGFEILKIGPVS